MKFEDSGQRPVLSTLDIVGNASCAVGGRLDTESMKVAFMDVIEKMVEDMVANHTAGDNLNLNAFVVSATIDFHHPEGVINEIAVCDSDESEFDAEVYDVETSFIVQRLYNEAFEDEDVEDGGEPRNMAFGGIMD